MKKQTTMKTMLAVLAATLAFSAMAADAAADAAKPASVQVKEEAAKAPVTLESALSFLPDVLAEVGGIQITKAQLIKQLSQK